jgi:hypothetical protein
MLTFVPIMVFLDLMQIIMWVDSEFQVIRRPAARIHLYMLYVTQLYHRLKAGGLFSD